MPTAEQIKQFLIGIILPPSISALATWIVVKVPLITTFFHISMSSVAGELSVVATFLVGWVITWLVQHKILAGHYTPAAKAAAREAHL